MTSDRELLLYIAAKVARLDAITSAIHAILHKDLASEDARLAELIEKGEEGIRDILEGRVDIPEAFQEPPNQDEEDRRNP